MKRNLNQLEMSLMATGSSLRMLFNILAALDQTADARSSRQLNTSYFGILFSNDCAFVIGDLFRTHLANGYAI